LEQSDQVLRAILAHMWARATEVRQRIAALPPAELQRQLRIVRVQLDAPCDVNAAALGVCTGVVALCDHIGACTLVQSCKWQGCTLSK
jgi:hypothetical protein